MVDRVVFYRNSQFALSIIQRGARCNTFRSALSRDYTAHCGRGSGEERADVRSYLLEIGHPTAADEHPWRCQLDKGPASNAITLSTYGQYRLGGGRRYSVGSRGEMFYLTTHSTHFIYGYMASDIWLRTILIVRKETRCRHMGYSYRLTARVLLYAPSHRQDNTYHGLCYTSHGALAGTRNSSMGPPHEGSIRRPTAP